MSVETAVVVALSVASTSAAGLASGADPADRPRWADVDGQSAVILGANVILLPALAAALAHGLDLGAAGTGLIVAAAAPGGSTGPLLATLAGAEPRVAARWFLVLTTVGTLTGLAAAIVLAAEDGLRAAVAALLVLLTSLAPLMVAEAYARRRPAAARELAGPVARLGLLLLVVTVGMLALRHAHQASATVIGAGAVLVAATTAIGHITRGPRARRLAIAQVSTVRNLTLALLVLSAVAAPGEAFVAVLGYGLAMFVGAGLVAAWTRYAAPA